MLRSLFFIFLITILSVSACSPPATTLLPIQTPAQNVTSTFAAPVVTQSPVLPPLSEAEIPRVSAEDAKAAVDRGEAIIMDVRSSDAYAASHIAGAINIELTEIESNPEALNLDKNQWIITYCT